MGIESIINSLNKTTKQVLKQRLLNLDPKKFQSLVYDLLVEMGFDEATMRRYSNDGGIDVTGIYRGAGLTQVNAAVQVKRWKSNVHAPEVQKVRGALEVGQQGIIVTTSSFSAGARADASLPTKAPVSLIDGDTLVELLVKHKVGVVAKPYLVLQIDEELWQELGVPGGGEFPSDSGMSEISDLRTVARERSKPDAIRILDVEYAISSWREGLLKTVEVLYLHDPETFEQRVVGMGGKKRTYVGDSPENMYAPERVANLPLFVETNESASRLRTRCSQIAEAMGIGRDAIRWE